MRKILLAAALLLFSTFRLLAAQDSIDSLKQQLQLAQTDSLKAYIYGQLADQYIKFDSVMQNKHGRVYQNEAIRYTLLAVHMCSRVNDTLNLRVNFDRLASVYHMQEKNVEAKWFILQSNTLSRAKKDIPNIINSLLLLAEIQTDIKDYDLAERNLAEALSLSVKNHYQKQQADVEQKYAFFYNRTKDYEKADAAMKKHDSIAENIRKDEQARLMTLLNEQNEQLKKKAYLNSSDSSMLKSNYSKKIASF